MKIAETTSAILKELKVMIAPGVSTMDLEKKAEELLTTYGVKSYNKGYKPLWAETPYPFILCVNVNDEIAHGMPLYSKILKEGDLVSVDIGIYDENDDCGDAAFSMGVGEISNKDKHLLFYSNQLIFELLPMMKTGAETEVIAQFIQNYALKHNFLVNRRFGGHRIAKQMHVKPNIYSSLEPGHKYATLEAGQVYCLEPMLTYSRDDLGVYVDGTKWTVRTADGKKSCFFEAMVEVCDYGGKMLTDHFENMRYDKNI